MSSSADSRHVVISPHVRTREVDGELVLLDLANEDYLGLDAVGLRMWNALTAEPSIDRAIVALLDVYEVEPERLRADLDRLVEDLAARGLVEVRDGVR